MDTGPCPSGSGDKEGVKEKEKSCERRVRWKWVKERKEESAVGRRRCDERRLEVESRWRSVSCGDIIQLKDIIGTTRHTRHLQ